MRDREEVWRAVNVPLERVDAVAVDLGERLPREGVVALEGGMGLGKTTWVRAICRSWGIPEGVASPTFGLAHTHRTADGRTVHHLDLYRLRDEGEAWDLGLEMYFEAPALSLVEWPERAGDALPQADLRIALSIEGQGRRCELRPGTGAGQAWLDRLQSLAGHS